MSDSANGRHCNNLVSYNHEPLHPQTQSKVSDTSVCPKRKHFLIAFVVNDNGHIIFVCSNYLIVSVNNPCVQRTGSLAC